MGRWMQSLDMAGVPFFIKSVDDAGPLVEAQQLVEDSGEDVKVDWHGHRDRGLDLANTLSALEAGATRVHGTALGIGERVGNTPMEQLLVNLQLLGCQKMFH